MTNERNKIKTVASPTRPDIWDRAMYMRLRDRHIDLDVTFLIWRGMVFQTIGIRLERSHFDESLRAWTKNPKGVPMITLAMDAERNIDSLIVDEWRSATALAA
jgi:hypothetical protein